ncbi:MAG: hypothetical protein AAGL98_00285 [Planctomycetota bacterium]
MRYWGLSQLMPYLHTPAARAFGNILARRDHGNDLAPEFVSELATVAAHLLPVDMPELAVVESAADNAGWRRVFKAFPSFEEWMALERICVVQSDAGMLYLLIDALH